MSTLIRVFKITNKLFSVSIVMIMWLFLFILQFWWTILFEFSQGLKWHCMTGINSIWFWHIIFFIHPWIQLPTILLRFASPFTIHAALEFSFPECLHFFQGYGNSDSREWVGNYSLCCHFLKNLVENVRYQLWQKYHLPG